MNEKIVASSMGIYTALGKGVQANFEELKNEQTTLSHLEYLQTIHANQFPFGEIKSSTQSLLDSLNLPNKEGYTRTTLLALHALQEAIAGANIDLSKNLRVGIINATTVGGMCEVEKYYFDMLAKKGDYSEFSDTIDCADCTHLSLIHI